MSKQKRVFTEKLSGFFAPRLLLVLVALFFVSTVTLSVFLILGRDNDTGTELVAIVNGEKIYRDDLTSALYARSGQEILEQLINRVLFEQEAKKLGLEVGEDKLEQEIQRFIDYNFQGSKDDFYQLLEFYDIDLEQFFDDTRFKLLASELIIAKYPISDEESKEFFMQYRYLFEEPEQVEARHIVVESLEEAEAILEMLMAGDDFAELAGKYSIDPSNKDLGGELGFFSRDMMTQSFSDAAFALEIGEISEPVATYFGYHIIQVTNRKAGGEVEYDDISDEVKRTMVESMLEEMIPYVISELRVEAEIEYILQP